MKAPHAASVTLLLALIAAFPPLAFAPPTPAAPVTITGVQVIPAHPTDADSVDIRVTGYFLDGCWSVGPASCGPVFGGTMQIAINAVDRWQPGGACPLVIIDHDQTCHYGRLPAGNYHVVFTENHSSLREPSPQQATLDFSVSAPTPTLRTTWGRLKALYR